jgi:stromal membrane-associated protein
MSSTGGGRLVSKVEKERVRLVQEKCQAMLNDMLRDEDNKYCVDCDAKGYCCCIT